MSESKKAAAIAALVSISVGLFFMAAAAVYEGRAKHLAEQAIDIALDAKDSARIGSWHLMIAQTGPHPGMPVTWRNEDLRESAGILTQKVGDAWFLAVFDQARAEWAVIGPMLEGNKEERNTWTPAICSGMRPGFQGVGHEHAHELEIPETPPAGYTDNSGR